MMETKMNHKEDPCSELNLLREKIRKLEKENDQLKARQSVYESTGEFSSLVLLTILTISKNQTLFQAFILSDWDNWTTVLLLFILFAQRNSLISPSVKQPIGLSLQTEELIPDINFFTLSDYKHTKTNLEI